MFSTLLPKLISLTSMVGETIMALHKDNMGFIVKSDNTPLTQADKISHNLITETLKKITPGVPILSDNWNQYLYMLQNWEKSTTTHPCIV